MILWNIVEVISDKHKGRLPPSGLSIKIALNLYIIYICPRFIGSNKSKIINSTNSERNIVFLDIYLKWELDNPVIPFAFLSSKLFIINKVSSFVIFYGVYYIITYFCIYSMLVF
jgi:hypothetical protein